VRILAEGDTFDFHDLANHIQSQLKNAPPPLPPKGKTDLALPGKRPEMALSATTVKLFENSVTKFKHIYKKTKDGVGCDQLRYYVENATEDGM